MANLKNVSAMELINIDRNENTKLYMRKRVRAELFNRYNRYIYKMANQYKTYSPLIGFNELVSAGQVALVEAIDDYDPKKGTYFSTWAYNHIKFGIWHALREDKGIPKYYKAIGVSDNSSSDDNREFDVPDEKSTESVFRLTTNEKARLLEIVEDLSDNVDKYCVIVSRFGLDGTSPKSNQECCKLFNMVPSKVSGIVTQFKRRAIKKYGQELADMYVV